MRLQSWTIPIFTLSAVIGPVDGFPTLENLARMMHTSDVPETRCPYTEHHDVLGNTLAKRTSSNVNIPISGMSKLILSIYVTFPLILMVADISFGTTCIPTA